MKSAKVETKHLAKILEAKNAPADLARYLSKQKHFSSMEQKSLCNLREEFELLFDSSLGKWKGQPYHIQLKKDTKPSLCQRHTKRHFGWR